MLARIALAVLSLLVVLACGGAPRPATQPPVPTPTTGTPTQAGGATATPAGATATPGGVTGTGACSLITTAELSAILGAEMNQAEASATECSWFATTGFPGINLRFEEGDLGAAGASLANPQDITVAGHPAVVGSLMGVIVYVGRGNIQLVVQSVFTDDTPEVRQQIIRIAETAVGRWR